MDIQKELEEAKIKQLQLLNQANQLNAQSRQSLAQRDEVLNELHRVEGDIRTLTRLAAENPGPS